MSDDLIERLLNDAACGHGAASDWSAQERADYWAAMCKKARRNAKEAATRLAELEAQNEALRSQLAEDAFQARVGNWMAACFTPEITADKLERADRFIEEALELVQATGYCAERAHELVDYVFNRPVGEPFQEVGGVMVTLAALCNPHGLSLNEAAETELARIWTKIHKIRAKQASKPFGSALPVPTAIRALKEKQ